jgi:hypothetical protein
MRRANIQHMSDLSNARNLLEKAATTKGRTLEARWDDLCRAVEQIIVHLEKLERANKPK